MPDNNEPVFLIMGRNTWIPTTSERSKSFAYVSLNKEYKVIKKLIGNENMVVVDSCKNKDKDHMCLGESFSLTSLSILIKALSKENLEFVVLDSLDYLSVHSSENSVSKFVLDLISASKIKIIFICRSFESLLMRKISSYFDNVIDAEKEELLGESDLFRKVLQSTDTSILVTNPRLKDNPIVFCNSAFTKLTGYSAKEIMGKNCRFLQGKKRDEKKVAKIKKAIESKKEIVVDVVNYTKKGRKFLNRLAITPIFSKGKLVYFMGIQRPLKFY